MKWIKWILLGLLLLIIAFITVQYVQYQSGIKAVKAALPGESQVIEAALGPIEYQIHGKSDRYLLLIHGTPGSYHTYMADVLVNEGFTVIAPSRPGYFRTSLSSGKTISQQADLYAALLDKLDIDSAAIIGYSGGGPSSIKFAIQHPNRCSALVLMATAGRSFKEPSQGTLEKLIMDSEFGRWVAYSAVTSEFQNADTAAIALNYVQTGFFPKDKTDIGEQNDFKQFLTPWEANLSSIQCPTLIIHGTEDEILPFTEAIYLHEQIPNSTLVKEDGKDHFKVVFIEFDKNLRATAKFLNNVWDNTADGINSPNSPSPDKQRDPIPQ